MSSKEKAIKLLEEFGEKVTQLADYEDDDEAYMKSLLEALQLKIVDDKYVNVEPLIQIVTTADKYMESFVSSDPVVVSLALFDTTAPVTSSLEGQITSIFVSLMGAILSVFKRKGTPAIYNSIKETFKEMKGDIIIDTISGMVDLFTVSQVILNSTIKENLRTPGGSPDIGIEGSLGLEGLDQVRTFILEKLDADSLYEAKKVLQYVQAYCQLVVIRVLLLQQKAACLSLLNRGQEVKVIEELIKTDLSFAKNQFLEFLRVAPSVDKRIVTSLYSPDAWPVIAGFLSLIKMPGLVKPQPYQRVLITEDDQLCVTRLRLTESDTKGYWFIEDAQNEVFFKTDDVHSVKKSPEAKTLLVKFLYAQAEDKCLLSPLDQPDKVFECQERNHFVATSQDIGENMYWKVNLEYAGKLLTPSF